MSNGATLLRRVVQEHRDATGVTQEWIAKNHFRTTNASLSDWLNEKSRPNATYRRVIALATGGRVPVEAWDTAEDRRLFGSIRQMDAA